MKINEHEGKKYLKAIHSPVSPLPVMVDIYAVLEAFEVTCPARAHAIKKLLMPGQRGKGGVMADLKGAQAAINRAMELEEVRQRKDITFEEAFKRFPELEEQLHQKPGGDLPQALQDSMKAHTDKVNEKAIQVEVVPITEYQDLLDFMNDTKVDKPTLTQISAPIWVKQDESETTDPEVLVVLALDLADTLHKMDPEDHRYIEHLIRDAGTIFCKQHESDDPKYWDDKCFLDTILKFQQDVIIAINKAGGGNWINNKYRMSHGKETLEDILKRYK